MKLVNLYSATIGTLRRFAPWHRTPRLAEKRTYVFILVPFDFSKNGHAKKAEVAQHLLDNPTDSDGARSFTLARPPTIGRTEIRGASKITGDGGVSEEPQLDFRLMWTWFLPNPLWKPKRRE